MYLRTLSDCVDNGAILAIKCGECDRIVYVAPYDLIDRKVGNRTIPSSAYLSEIEHLLICRGGQGSVGCGAKNAGVRAVWSHEVRGVPQGISPLLWLNADDRERKRLIRKARG